MHKENGTFSGRGDTQSRIETTTGLGQHINARTVLRGSVAVIAIAVALSGCANTPESDVAREGASAAKANGTAHSGNSLLGIADAMAADGDHSAAIPVYRRAHAKDSGDAAPLIGLGRSLMAMGQVIDAHDAFSDAVDREGKNPDALAGLGSSLLMMDRANAAKPIFERALNVAPGHPEALRGLALSQDMTGQHEAALETYERALGSSDDLKLRNNYGLSLALFGDTEKGIEVLENVMRDDRAGPSQRQNMALAYMLAGREDESRNMAAIDQGLDSLEKTLDYFRIIKMLPAEDRITALVAGTVPPKHDTSEPANRSYDSDSERKAETAQRLVGVEEEIMEEPFPEPEPEPEPIPEPEPAPHEDADLSGIPLMAPGEGWSLQIAAYRKASELVEGWDILREKYFDIIGDLDPRRTEVDFGDRAQKPNGFFYRLNAGPLTTLEEAVERCDRMRAIGADCWVRPPEEGENTQPTPELTGE
jgi:tetratricopeptide (TPR) repeat protein